MSAKAKSCHLRRERGRQVDPDEGVSGVYPHGSYEGQIIYKGEEQHFRSIRDSEYKAS